MRLPAALAGLPIADAVAGLREALAGTNAAIVVAPPGAGKTTCVPIALLDEAWLGGRRIALLEPRRLAARAAARRMADVLGEAVGATVGYQTRDERRIGPNTRIEVLTEGILTRRLQHDPSLDGIGVVIFDEVHERNLATDLGLALALDAQRIVRPDLRIVAMSATPDTSALRRVLVDVPIVSSDGRMHPVEVRWRPRRTDRGGDRLEPAVATTVREALADEPGDLLVFLPGIAEIRRTQALLDDLAATDVLPLAGALSLADQDAALAPSSPGRRRVVLATDIAESSLTVPGVRVVVDAGLARVPRHDVRTGMTRLVTVSSSRASADQRAGRAGRTEPGACYRLWSKVEHTTRLAHLPAEITQVDLAGLALELAAWGTAATDLAFVDQPPPKALRHAEALLTMLGALDGAGRLTDAGRRMLRLPLHPRLARMIEYAAPGDRSLACVVAAILDDRDVFRGRPSDLPCDLALRVAAVAGEYGHDAVDRGAARRAGQRAVDIGRRAGIDVDVDVDTAGVDPSHTGRVLLAAYPDRLAVRRNRPGNFQLRLGTAATMAPTDSLSAEAFVVAAELDGDRTRAAIRLAAAVDAAEVIDGLADQIEVRTAVVFDAARQDIVELVEHRLGGMLLAEQRRAPTPGPETTAALLEHVRRTRLGALDTHGASGLRARVAHLRSIGDDTWPDWSDRALLATLDAWLAPFLAGATSTSELARLDLGMALSTELGWDGGQRLAELAPATLATPAGRDVRIDYSRATPTASVRVQDMFGLDTHPTAAGQPVTLELLSPADRPLQITSDLPGFWRGSWADVRKEMAGRYPKHFWPAEPWREPPRRASRER